MPETLAVSFCVESETTHGNLPLESIHFDSAGPSMSIAPRAKMDLHLLAGDTRAACHRRDHLHNFAAEHEARTGIDRRGPAVRRPASSRPVLCFRFFVQTPRIWPVSAPDGPRNGLSRRAEGRLHVQSPANGTREPPQSQKARRFAVAEQNAEGANVQDSGLRNACSATFHVPDGSTSCSPANSGGPDRVTLGASFRRRT